MQVSFLFLLGTSDGPWRHLNSMGVLANGQRTPPSLWGFGVWSYRGANLGLEMEALRSHSVLCMDGAEQMYKESVSLSERRGFTLLPNCILTPCVPPFSPSVPWWRVRLQHLPLLMCGMRSVTSCRPAGRGTTRSLATRSYP